MPDPSRTKRWILLGLAAIVLATLLSTIVRVDVPEDLSSRAIGTADDIEALKSRSDINVLFIVIDTLRADRLGMYGYERNTSKCSMASLWTGFYPARTGITRFDDVIPAEARLPAEILRDAGFQTVGIYRNGWVASTFGFDQGFDVYQRPSSSGIPPDVKRQNPTLSDQGTDQDVVAAAVEFLRVDGRKRWFLYLHLMDVHEYLYDQESALFGTTFSDVYDNAIRWTDSTLSLLFDHLAAGGYLDDTIVVITSDHGEAFRERGFEGHARKVYRETTEIPFILSLPFRLEPGVVVRTRSQGVDVWPTVLDLIGLEAPADADGRSLVPAMVASARGSALDEPEHTAIAHLDQGWAQRDSEPRPTVAVVEGPLRFVRVEQSHEYIDQLFDRTNDPLELEDRAHLEPEAVERLRAVADGYLQEAPVWGRAPKKELSELELNHLRALGYALP